MFDWGDSTDSGWLGSYDSDSECAASYTWTSQGDFEIKVKAKDIHGLESEWSDPLSVTIPKYKGFSLLIYVFLENHPNLFLLLQRFLEL